MTARHAIASAAFAAALLSAGYVAAEPNASPAGPIAEPCPADASVETCARGRALPDPDARADVGERSSRSPRVAIIIDDLGYDLASGRRAIELPGTVSVAILPGAPHSARLAHAANERGRDILLHLPMQAHGDEAPSETLNLTLDMSRARLAETVAAAFELVPYAIGLNNHRGSLITRHPGHMQWLMDTLAERESLIFVDSYTTPASVALAIAAETGIDAVKRDVFLDADPSPSAIERELERLRRIASKRGAAVAIAHPYPQTLALLETALPEFARRGYELVAISELVPNSAAAGHSKMP